MSATSNMRRQASAARPLVLALTATPLLTDLLRDQLDEVATVRNLPAGSVDLGGLVRHTVPDALVIDSAQNAAELSAVAHELSVPLVQILLPSRQIRLFRDGRWDPVPLSIESPTTIRNVLLGELFRALSARRGPLPALPPHADHELEASPAR
jgi:hypothetical protein